MRYTANLSLIHISVLEDAPDNSLFVGEAFELDQYTRRAEVEIPEANQWMYLNSKIYLLLDKNTHIDTFEKKITNYTRCV